MTSAALCMMDAEPYRTQTMFSKFHSSGTGCGLKAMVPTGSLTSNHIKHNFNDQQTYNANHDWPYDSGPVPDDKHSTKI